MSGKVEGCAMEKTKTMKQLKINLIWLAIVLFFAFSSWILLSKYKQERNDRVRLERSYKAANSKIEYYRTLNNDLVAKNEVIQLKYSELKEIYPEILSELRNMKIKSGRVNSYTETVIESEKQITTVLRDSTINDTVVVRTFNYRDEFYHVSGTARGDSQKVNIHSTDSLMQVVYKGERIHPWLWIFSSRKLEQAITCKNPNARVVYSKHIEIIRK